MGKLVWVLFCALFVTNFAFADEINVLKNPGFESRTSQWSKTGSSTFTLESTSPLAGLLSAKWNPSATGEFFRSSTYTIPDGLKGTTCLIEMKYLWDSGTSGHIVMNVDDGTNNIASLSLEPTSGGVSRRAMLNFTCPSSGTVRFELESTANAAEITVDNGHLGSAKNAAQISQSELTAYAYFPVTTSCAWTLNSGTFADFPADTDCPSITVVSSSQPVNTADTDLPQIVFPNLLPGKYTVTARVHVALSVEEAHSKALRISDGTNLSPVCGNSHNSGTGGSETNEYICVLNVTYGTGAPRTFKIQGMENGATGSIILQNGSFFSETTFEVRKDPVQSAEALTLETSGWRVDANIAGANPDLGTADQASYIGIENAGLTLTNNSGTGVINAQIPCSGTNPPTGTTCAAGNESVGVSVNIPRAGDVRACASFAHNAITGASGGIIAGFQIVETANNAQTIIQEGKSRVASVLATANTSLAFPHQVCGTLFLGAGQKTLRLMYEQDTTATVSQNLILADASAAAGQRDIHWEIYPLDQQIPAPVFTEVKEKVRSSTPGMRMEKVTVAYNCTASPCTMVNPTGGISSVTRASAGAYTVIFSPSYTVAPTCVVSDLFSGGFAAASLNGVATTTQQLVTTALTVTGALSDQGFSIICMGLH